MSDQLSPSGWPDDAEDVPDDVDQPLGKLLLLYGLPFVILYVLPSLAWIALLPGAVAVRRSTRAPHRRRLLGIYLATAAISIAPWILLVVRGDGAELFG